MRLRRRSFPHPVVGNGDDAHGVAFQATVEISSDKEFFYIDALIACSSATVNKLIASGDAKFAVHVECGSTFFRQVYEFTETTKRIAIPADNLIEQVEVNVFTRALKPIPAYTLDQAHADYSGATFSVQIGDILAISEGFLFDAVKNFDSLSNIGAIMQVSESQENGDVPMKAYFEGDKIVIFLSKQDFKAYKELKCIPQLSGMLTTAIVLPVLVDALTQMKEDVAELEGYRWFKSLKQRIAAKGLASESSPLVTAQVLLDLPMKRAFASAQLYAGGAE